MSGIDDPRASWVVFEKGNAQYALTCADNRDALSDMCDASVDLAVISPPYFGQREYSSLGLGNVETIEEYLDNIIKTFKQIVRVVKPIGNIVYNLGDKIIDGSLQLAPYRFAIVPE